MDEDLARVGAIRAEDGPGDLGPAGADEPGEAEDLAPSELEADVADHPTKVEVADLEDDLVLGVLGNLGRLLEDRPADHHRDDLVETGLGRREVCDVAAVAHHRHPVGDLLQLLEPVRDVDDPDARSRGAGG